jgi:hypothetical protein
MNGGDGGPARDLTPQKPPTGGSSQPIEENFNSLDGNIGEL